MNDAIVIQIEEPFITSNGHVKHGVMFDYDKVNQIVDTIAREFSPQKIIIFGSVARHEATERSDLDLLVVMDTDRPYHTRTLPIMSKLFGIRMPIDMFVLTPDEFEVEVGDIRSIAHRAISTGVVVYAT